MEATQILMAEHRIIERVILALETAAGRLEQDPKFRAGFFIDTADFIKGFADGCHHRKEEGALFPAIAANGVPVEGGPIGVMLSEHEQGRLLTRAMRQAAERLAAGDLSAKTKIIHNARSYAVLLRQHIQKEDQVLFPMAERVIPLEQQNLVAQDFERVEHEETGEGIHEKYLALANQLELEAGAAQ